MRGPGDQARCPCARMPPAIDDIAMGVAPRFPRDLSNLQGEGTSSGTLKESPAVQRQPCLRPSNIPGILAETLERSAALTALLQLSDSRFLRPFNKSWPNIVRGTLSPLNWNSRILKLMRTNPNKSTAEQKKQHAVIPIVAYSAENSPSVWTPNPTSQLFKPSGAKQTQRLRAPVLFAPIRHVRFVMFVFLERLVEPLDYSSGYDAIANSSCN